MFLLLSAMFDMVFRKYLELSFPNKTKDQFFGSQNFGGVYNIGHTLQNTLLDHTLH